MPTCDLRACLNGSLHEVYFPGAGGFVRQKRIETAGRNPRRQWNTAIHSQMAQGGETPVF